jgi:hypothetical protein
MPKPTIVNNHVEILELKRQRAQAQIDAIVKIAQRLFEKKRV